MIDNTTMQITAGEEVATSNKMARRHHTELSFCQCEGSVVVSTLLLLHINDLLSSIYNIINSYSEYEGKSIFPKSL